MSSATERPGPAPLRGRLSHQLVLRAAVELADREGLDALTMRRLAAELGVEAMSLYHHVANKEALLDGVVEAVTDEVVVAVAGLEGPDPADDWRGAMRARILAARSVMLRHPWVPRVLVTRTSMNPAMIGYYDGVLGVLRAGGFDWDLAHHAVHALGSRALGFVQEPFQPDQRPGGCDDQREFEFGLDVLLDGLERRRSAP